MTPIDTADPLPFTLAHRLRAEAIQAVGEAHLLDLSQGEPGYGYRPGVEARRVVALLGQLEAALGPAEGPSRWHAVSIRRLERWARACFAPATAEDLLLGLRRLIARAETAMAAQGMATAPGDILGELLDYASLAGGRYPRPLGAELFRALAAERLGRSLGLPVSWREILPVLGASHGIATLFKVLGEEGIGWLRPGDRVLTTSPMYAPFNAMLEERGLAVGCVPLDPETGGFDAAMLEALEAGPPAKVVFLVNPNNPTGHPAPAALLGRLAALAEAQGALLVSDEVYRPFFEAIPSLAAIPAARKRWIRIDSLSKIERSAGLRVGEIYLSDEANAYLSARLPIAARRTGAADLRDLLTLGRSPGGFNLGLFRHIAGLPGPSLALAVAHLGLGEESRRRFVASVRARSEGFYRAMGLPWPGNRYFGLLDLGALAAPGRRGADSEERLLRLARRGLVLMPAQGFFGARDRQDRDRRGWVRLSLPNLTQPQLLRAAALLQEELGWASDVPALAATA